MKYLVSLFLIGSLLTGMKSYAQMGGGDKSKRPSPPAMASGVIAGIKVMVDYSSPSVKGRKIYGDLEKFGSVWRAGANEATVISFDKNVKINGKPLAKGKYAFFIKLNSASSWTLIFNKKFDQWGTEYDTNKSQDVLKVDVTPSKIAPVEKLKYVVSSTGVQMMWETMEMKFTVSAN